MNTRNLLSAMLLSSATAALKNNTTLTFNTHQEAMIYNQFDVINVTNQVHACQPVDGFNPKKRCKIDNDIYYMKAVSHRSLGEIFNRQFVRKNLGIMTPTTEIMWEENGKVYHRNGSLINTDLYVSAKKIPHYEPAHTFFKSYVFTHYDNRAHFIEKMGEHNIAKFGVASTFIGDLKLTNWGASQRRLVLVDVDDFPKTLIELLNAASDNLIENFSGNGLNLNLADIQRMKKIYQRMLTMPLPTVDPSVDLPNEIYSQALNMFIKSCQMTIDQGNQFIQNNQHDKTTNMEHTLVNAIRENALNYDNSFSRQLKYYFSF